jgi:hypothetical protein
MRMWNWVRGRGWRRRRRLRRPLGMAKGDTSGCWSEYGALALSSSKGAPLLGWGRGFSNPAPIQRHRSRVEIKGSYLPGCRLPAPFLTNFAQPSPKCFFLDIWAQVGRVFSFRPRYISIGWVFVRLTKGQARLYCLKRRLLMESRFEICRIAGMSGGVVRRRSRYVPPSWSSAFRLGKRLIFRFQGREC